MKTKNKILLFKLTDKSIIIGEVKAQDPQVILLSNVFSIDHMQKWSENVGDVQFSYFEQQYFMRGLLSSELAILNDNGGVSDLRLERPSIIFSWVPPSTILELYNNRINNIVEKKSSNL